MVSLLLAIIYMAFLSLGLPDSLLGSGWPVMRLELGAGAVDAALNNYVAVHYSSRQMSWLHAFWGVGVTISPYIMSSCLTGGLGWQTGYRRVSLLQIVLTVILFAALPLWLSLIHI